MADYPCDNHGIRYNGPSNRVYINIYREEQAIKLKENVCSDCLAALIEDWLGHSLHQTPSGGWDPPTELPDLEYLWIDAGAPSRPLNGYRRS